jgi:hypothetical protein
MTDNRYLPICKKCRWYDRDNAQCYDGHLQYSGKQECEGFKLARNRVRMRVKRRESALNASDDKI